MYQRHDEVPFLVERMADMEAVYFNRVQLALRRLNGRIRLPIPGLKTLDLIVQPAAWIVVDRAFNDVPVIAWSDFDTDTRTPCTNRSRVACGSTTPTPASFSGAFSRPWISCWASG